MAHELVHLTHDGPVATITLDSHQNRNALSRALVGDLRRQVARAIDDPSVRVVVLTAAGTVFCSGADLKEQREANESGGETGPGPLVPILTAILDAPKPFVARVNGPARAGGLGLLAACDITVAADTATFAFSEVRIGVAPAIISVVCIPRMGVRNARDLMLTGETFDAGRAKEVGLVDALSTPSELDAAVGRYVDAFLACAPGALAATKELLRRVPALPVDQGFTYAADLSARLFASEEAREGMTAFAEKRPPRWAAE